MEKPPVKKRVLKIGHNKISMEKAVFKEVDTLLKYMKTMEVAVKKIYKN